MIFSPKVKKQISDKLNILTRKIIGLKSRQDSFQHNEHILRLQRDINRMSSDNLDMNKAFRIFGDDILEIANIDCTSLYLFDNNNAALNLVQQIGLSPTLSIEIPSLVTDSPLSSSFFSGKPLKFKDSKTHHPLRQTLRSQAIRHFSLIPIRQKGQLAPRLPRALIRMQLLMALIKLPMKSLSNRSSYRQNGI